MKITMIVMNSNCNNNNKTDKGNRKTIMFNLLGNYSFLAFAHAFFGL